MLAYIHVFKTGNLHIFVNGDVFELEFPCDDLSSEFKLDNSF